MTRELLDTPEPVRDQDVHVEPDSGWWATYLRLGLGNLSATAREIVASDSVTIAEAMRPASPETSASPFSNVRTGIVVGAVQSGKTASMLGCSAKLLDQGLGILVVLGGTRLNLWRQTFERFVEQLDGDYTRSIQRNRRLMVPSPRGYSPEHLKFSAHEYILSAGTDITRALISKKPVIIILPKHQTHLNALRRALDVSFAELPEDTPPIHMAVFDDEADDASVLDANAKELKDIPRLIENLWKGNKDSGSTRHPALYATYTAYTASPQANFLQHTVNPLAPTDFCLALRAPYKTGNTGTTNRTPTFSEPAGLKSFYCGGDFFYGEFEGLESGRLCRTREYPKADDYALEEAWEKEVEQVNYAMLGDGLRAYMVAAAIRHCAHLKSGGVAYSDIVPFESPSGEFNTKHWPKPHSCLIHPSANQDDHFHWRKMAVKWSWGFEVDDEISDAEIRRQIKQNASSMSSNGLTARLGSEQALWRSWYDDYQTTRSAVQSHLPMSGFLNSFDASWLEVCDALRDHIFPYVRLKVINSSKDADDRPSFEPQSASIDNDMNRIVPPDDLLTIFISGNVMARGITLEGLTTSVFLRSVDAPAADTQMQMQRWFGYRGQFAHLIRLFLYEEQLYHFKEYHEHDVLVRTEILKNMDLGVHGTAPRTLLHGLTAWATRKVTSDRVPLHPGSSPIISIVDLSHGNIRVVEAFVERHRENLVPITPVLADKGLICSEPHSLAEIADILDEFEYATHDPGEESDDAFSIWSTLERRYNLVNQDSGVNWFRPNRNDASNIFGVPPKRCPYSVAAYLRFWETALSHKNFAGLYPSDEPKLPWKTGSTTMTAPKFYVGIRSGSKEPWTVLPSIRCVQRNSYHLHNTDLNQPSVLSVLWGANPNKDNPGEFLGDQRFDFHFSNEEVPSLPAGRKAMWRPRGSSGLLLFYIIEPENNNGKLICTVGLCLPHGGPTQVLALR